MYGIGGARISAQDGCTVRIDPDGSVVAATGVTEQGQGTEAIIRQIVAEARRRADRAGARHHRRHADHALRRRHLGLPRRRHRRRGGAAGRHGGQGGGAQGGRRHAAGGSPTRSTSSTARSSTSASGQRAHAARRARPHRLLPRRHAAARPAARADADAPLHHQAIPVRLHQRRAGLLARGRRRHRHGASC